MKAMASSRELTAITGRTGPSTSFCMMGSVSVTSVRMVGAAKKRKRAHNGITSEARRCRDPPALTDVLLCFYHLSARGHLAGPQQELFSAVEVLQIDHAAVAAGLRRVGAVELRHAALQGLHQASRDVGVAQDVVGGHGALPGVVETGPGDALRRGGDLALLVHVARVLRRQHQSDGRDGASGRLSDPAPLLPASFTSRGIKKKNKKQTNPPSSPRNHATCGSFQICIWKLPVKKTWSNLRSTISGKSLAPARMT